MIFTIRLLSSFQFHKGTIKTSGDFKLASDKKFQFHKGTIKTMRRRKGTIFFNDFNSIMVQLRLAVTKNKTFVHPNFNSIKVQLRQERHNIHATSGIFQFHKGTIKTPAVHSLTRCMSPFQFHKGTIKTRVECEGVFLLLISIP